ncbi:TRAP transporter small permease [Pseudodonghicola flavimaris]|uniref:TRAP transporter small permease protein n=1 Tax=Pseudodonghicola flavimaris TaxID=3050036 RepID=A0ABT7F1D5_9RHOB|nr:TRAP transporter small permease [Pseudodonghicola flavimaris]MDK3018402.1 TRAP transporter small permease [Pseudodonghicola flavimaris]
MFGVLRLVSRAATGLAGIGIIIMLVLVTSDVLMRAIFNIALPGIDAIVASYLMVATIFLPLALLEVLDENIAVDALRNAVPDLMKDLFDIVAYILGAAFYALLGWLYFKVAIEAFEVREYVTGTWDVPIWPARVFMPIGLILAAAVAAAKLIIAIRMLVTGQKPSDHHTAGSF